MVRWKHPEVPEGLLDGRTFFRLARREAGVLEHRLLYPRASSGDECLTMRGP